MIHDLEAVGRGFGKSRSTSKPLSPGAASENVVSTWPHVRNTSRIYSAKESKTRKRPHNARAITW